MALSNMHGQVVPGSGSLEPNLRSTARPRNKGNCEERTVIATSDSAIIIH